MTKPSLLLSSLIDVELWDRAGWLGLAFVLPAGESARPALGFAFRDRVAGVQIFSEWAGRLGNRDRHEEIRISIVTEPSGPASTDYLVYVTSNIDRIIERARAEGIDVRGAKIATLGRVHRLDVSERLANFQKSLVASGGLYEILPCVPGEDGAMEGLPDHAIEKMEIHIRRASEITDPNDLDNVPLGRKFGN